MDVRDNPRLVDLLVYSGADTTEFTKNGFRRFVSLYRNGTGSTTIFSIMLGGSFQLTEKLRADLGGRFELNDFVQSAENQTNIDLDGDPQTIYDNEQWGNKSFRHFSRSIDDYAISGGLNYAFTDRFAIYAQGSRAFKMPALDDFLDAQAEDQVRLYENRELVMVEGGVKYAAAGFAFTVNGFWGELTNNVGQGFERNQWVVRTFPDSRTYGAELEVSASPAPGLNFLGVGTYTKPETVESGGSALTAGGIPDFIGNLVASYSFQGIQIFADFHYVGTRPLVDAEYSVELGKYTRYNEYWELPSYTYMNLGLAYTFSGEALRLSADLLNVYQSIGLEEGNPREPGVQTFYFVARPLLPRRLTVSLSYQF
jgi:outer membrane receptor protein involved in Fe transport